MKLSYILGVVVQLIFVSETSVSSSGENDLEINVHPIYGDLWEGRRSNIKHPRFDDMHFGVIRETAEEKARWKTVRHPVENYDLPKHFDARGKWKRTQNYEGCTYIGQIRDQSKCGSCWSFGAVEAIADRLCIHSGYRFNDMVSAKHLLSCCEKCGHSCNGGIPIRAWEHWMLSGIVTEKCQPYPFPKCRHHGSGTLVPCPEKSYSTPQCNATCDDPNYDIQIELTTGDDFYYVEEGMENIMVELMERGPVEVAFSVYDDFLSYERGIFFHKWGKYLGGHAVRLIGWGEEHGVPYWILANSWNEEWGENGVFRMLRGVNECDIEQDVVAGLPSIYKP